MVGLEISLLLCPDVSCLDDLLEEHIILDWVQLQIQSGHLQQ